MILLEKLINELKKRGDEQFIRILRICENEYLYPYYYNKNEESKYEKEPILLVLKIIKSNNVKYKWSHKNIKEQIDESIAYSYAWILDQEDFS